jgi:predicted transcriptional regulator
MMIYNRRKKAEFFAEQVAQHKAAVHDAKLAVQHGIATEAQQNFLAREEAEDARIARLKEAKAKKGVFKKFKDFIFMGLKKEEEGEGVGSSEARLGFESLSEEDDGLGERESDVIRAIEDKKLEIQENAKKAFADEKERQRTGGPLDKIGTSTDNAGSGEEPPKSGGWTSFMTRR